MKLSFKTIASPGATDQLIRDFIAANDGDFYPPIATRRSLTDFVQSVYDDNGKYVVCFCDGVILGLTSVYLNHSAFIAYYHYIAIDKAFRHMGIGSRLYNYVHKICKENGIQKAMVKTWSTNEYSQSMFTKHGFFHIDTIEDDRSKGIHTYFFAKHFDDTIFRRPVKRIIITGSCDNYCIGNFVKTISSMPKTSGHGLSPIPFIAVSNPFSMPAPQKSDRGNDHDPTERIGEIMNGFELRGISHILFLDHYNYPNLFDFDSDAGIEILDLAAITKKLVRARNKKCLLIADDIPASLNYFDIDDIQIPGRTDLNRIIAIVDEIRSGKVSPAYHKHEIAKIALLNDCNAMVLGSVELHTMFGFDKMYNGIEIFDPWMEMAIIIQTNRMKMENKTTVAAKKVS